MAYVDAVWRRARADLVVAGDQGSEDLLLWEYASRVARTAVSLGKLPLISAFQPDGDVVLAASLYHPTAWAAMRREGRLHAAELLSRPLSDQNLERSAQILHASLTAILPEAVVTDAMRAVSLLNSRSNKERVELCIVADAVNLEEFSFTSLWPIIRRSVLDGHGVQFLLDTWDRRCEYQYWSARLSEGFHFDPVRMLARRRLADLEHWIETLRSHHRAIDIEESFDWGRGPYASPPSAS